MILLPVTNQLMIDKAANIYQSSFDGSHIQQLTHIPIQQKRPYPRKIGHVQQGVCQSAKRIDTTKRLLHVFNKTAGRRSNCKKEWWNQISLYPHLQTHAQVGIQTEEGTKKSTCKYCIQRGKRTF